MSNDQTISTKDCMGTLVSEGAVVRVLRIDPSVFDTLDTQEKEQVESLLGETFSVYEVDQYGRAWVEKWWHEDEAHAFSHSLALEPSDMKVVNEGRPNPTLKFAPLRWDCAKAQPLTFTLDTYADA